MINLHLGCGNKKHKDYTNIDIVYNPSVDEVANVRYLRNYKMNSVDKIYACHVLEHFSRWDYKIVLERWYTILKAGGRLRLAVPDFNAIQEYYFNTEDLDAVRGLLYGGQDYPNNNHMWIWDFASLKEDLLSVGFSNIARYDWRDDDFSDIDDFAKAYIPHKDFENGRLMSLNVECFKEKII